MMIGTDSAGNVLLVTENTVMPLVWEGKQVTPHVLTDEQKAAFFALGPNGGILFNGTQFTTLPKLAGQVP